MIFLAPKLSSGDLCRIISEVLDIPKTYGETYGLGPGSKVDSEILVYMKSQGWPERVQVKVIRRIHICAHSFILHPVFPLKLVYA